MIKNVNGSPIHDTKNLTLFTAIDVKSISFANLTTSSGIFVQNASIFKFHMKIKLINKKIIILTFAMLGPCWHGLSPPSIYIYMLDMVAHANAQAQHKDLSALKNFKYPHRY